MDAAELSLLREACANGTKWAVNLSLSPTEVLALIDELEELRADLKIAVEMIGNAFPDEDEYQRLRAALSPKKQNADDDDQHDADDANASSRAISVEGMVAPKPSE